MGLLYCLLLRYLGITVSRLNSVLKTFGGCAHSELYRDPCCVAGLVAVAVERDRSVRLQRQPRRPEGLSPKRPEHFRRRRVPVCWAALDPAQAVRCQVRREVSQPVAPGAAGAGAVGCRD